MPQTQSYVIKADSSQAEQANDRVNQGLKSIGDTAVSSADRSRTAFQSYAEQMARDASRAVQGVSSEYQKFAQEMASAMRSAQGVVASATQGIRNDVHAVEAALVAAGVAAEHFAAKLAGIGNQHAAQAQEVQKHTSALKEIASLYEKFSLGQSVFNVGARALGKPGFSIFNAFGGSPTSNANIFGDALNIAAAGVDTGGGAAAAAGGAGVLGSLGPIAAAAAGAYLTIRSVTKQFSDLGNQVDNTAFYAAKNKLPFSDASQLSTLSQYRDAPQKDLFFEAAKDLNKSLKTDTGSNALEDLHVSLSGSESDVDKLKAIATGFSGIYDPAQRARDAFALFPSVYHDILPQLTTSLSDSIDSMQKFNTELGAGRAREIGVFKENIQTAKDELSGLGDFFTSVKLKITGFFSGIGALAGNYVLGSIPGFISPAQEQSQYTPQERAQAAALGEDPADFRARNSALLGAYQSATAGRSFTSTSVAGLARTDALSALDAQKSTLDGVQAQISALETRRSADAATLEANRPGSGQVKQLSPDQVLAVSTNYLGTSRELTQLNAQKETLEQQKKLADQAEQATTEAVRRSAELTKSMNELTLKTAEGGPFAEAFQSIQRARQYVDPQGNRHSLDLNSQQQGLAAQAYGQAITEIQKKTSAEAVTTFTAENAQRLGFFDEQFGKQQDVEQQILQLRRQGFEKAFGAQRDYLAQSHSANLGTIDLSSDSYDTPVDKIRAQLVEQIDYITQGAALDLEQIQRQQRSTLADRGFTDEDLAKTTIDFGGPRDRLRETILFNSGQDALAVQRKQQADVLGAQQNSALDAAQAIKDANLQAFDSLKQQAGSVWDALVDSGRDRFHALGQLLKGELLGALKDVFSSQIAAGLFNVLNPGASVTGFESKNNGIARSGFGGAFSSIGLGANPVFSNVPRAFGGGAFSNLFSIGASTGGYGIGSSFTSSTGIASSFGFGGGFSGGTGIGLTGGGTLDFGYGSGYPGSIFGGGNSGYGGYGADVASQGAQWVSPLGVGLGLGYDGYSPDLSQATAAYGGAPAPGIEAQPVRGALGSPEHNAAASHGGLLSGLLGGGKGSGGGFSLSSLKGSVYNSAAGGAANASVAVSLGQGPLANAAGNVVGGVAGFAASPAGGTLGASLLLSSLSAKRSTVGTDAGATAGGSLLGANLASSGALGGLSEAGGAELGGGLGLAAAGIKRGGFGGLGEDVAGGALAGFSVAGPIGAAVGAGIGALAGLVRLFIPGEIQQIQKQVKDLYKLDISQTMAQQIETITKQNYGGQISVAIRAPEVIQLLQQYAEATGQKVLLKNTPIAANLTETVGGLKQAPTYFDASPISFASQAGVGVLNNQPTTVLKDFSVNPGTSKSNGTYYNSQTPQVIQLSLDGDSTTNFVQGGTVQAIMNNPRTVADAYAAAQNGSYDTFGNASRLLAPNLIYS